jgi:hypothetical protein
LCVACTSEELPASFSRAAADEYIAGKIGCIIIYCHKDGENKPFRKISKKLPVKAASYTRRL